jgi:hypothetical protein
MADHPHINVELYKKYYKISDEEMVLMQGVHLSKLQMSKKKKEKGWPSDL